MKTIAELEIYPTPNNGNGVRLPLCRDREMFTDKPMPLITYRGQQVQDVENYIAWLNDPSRQYMPKEKILGYLHYHSWQNVKPKEDEKGKAKTDEKSASKKKDQERWRGNMGQWLYEFWIEGNANNRPLNEHITVLCRLATTQGYSEKAIVKKVMAFISDLPSCATSSSSRLLKGKVHRIENVIRSTAKYACDNNGHQPDAKNSTEIFAAALMAWPGFDSLDKSTWKVPEAKTMVAQTAVSPNWTGDQRRRLIAFFRRPLFVKDDSLIIRLINGIVNLTIAKEKEGNGWGKEYLMKWMNDQFPEIKCAKDEKRQRIMRCLEEEGIIRAKFRGKGGMYATHWTLGTVAQQALGITANCPEQETISINQKSPQPSPITSIYYSSLFSDKDLLESGCKDGKGDDSELSSMVSTPNQPSEIRNGQWKEHEPDP